MYKRGMRNRRGRMKYPWDIDQLEREWELDQTKQTDGLKNERIQETKRRNIGQKWMNETEGKSE